ncbi:efflux RND transporter periplasmic adaptor subunit [Antarcticibacterium flavum]|uniref:Efflux RND transporter periplasmic adaptor subunit n=1 Tax=Antarcticibacterium flavum TaxID=2058175 RepID=A0A5B7X524_9FLAO|nr:MULTISPECIES: efflux RND transporter periplasmic adaptor subunit [Antarcticibacterium]MCM4160174.1 efflux RND transporter periplasmic adaptor subunit [Antarcticibacterium sp. W02-3]QCY69723.1 efflux RND transporter periplasmic adaptor subunit [Antarcticibacterium flavum]
MKKIFSIVCLGMILLSCGDKNQEQAQAPATYPVIEVPVRTVTDYSSFPANIEGTINSAVRAKVPGYITRVLVDEGEQVKRGQLLFTLETESLTQDAEAARAAVNAAQVEVDKLVPLVEKNIISEVQLETAKAQLSQAKSNYNSITANIGYANIKSPVDGYVGAINFRSGNLVSPGDAQPLTTVSQAEEVYAFFAMNEADYYEFMEEAEGNSRQEKLDNMPPVKLILAGDREYKYEGEIKTINPQVDAGTGTVNFRATFPNPEGLLATGNSGRILIPRTYENVMVIPSKATYEAQGRIYTFRLDEGDTVRNTLLQGNKKIGDLLIVQAGINAGDRIVAEGVAKLRDGQRITPNPTELDSIAGQIQPVFK